MLKKELVEIMKKENRVNIRDIDKPIEEYPKGTKFVHSDNAFIPLPTKEQIEKHKQETISQ